MTSSKGIHISLAAGILATVLSGVWACYASKYGSSARGKARYYYGLGSEAQSQDREAEAYEFFKKAHEADPSYSEAAYAYGAARMGVMTDTLQSQEQLSASLDLVRQFVDEYPGDVYESRYYAYLADATKNPAEAVRVLERTYCLNPKESLTLFQLSDLYARSGKFDKAIDALGRYEQAEGRSPEMTTRKVSLYIAKGDTAGALAEIDGFVSQEPRNVSYVIMKGTMFDYIQQPDSALAYYRHAESMNPESGHAKLAVASNLYQRGDTAGYDAKLAEVLLSDDIDLDTKLEITGSYLQESVNEGGGHARGDRMFGALRDRYPHDARVLDLASRYSAAKGDYASAADQIGYAIDRDPENERYWGQLMTYLASGDRVQESLETFGKSKKFIEPGYDLKMHYAAIAMSGEMYDKAAEMYGHLIHDIEPGLPLDSAASLSMLPRSATLQDLEQLSNLYTSLGDALNSEGKTEKSWLAYENALVFDPSSDLARNNYAYFLSIKGGDLEKALKMSKAVIEGLGGKNPTYLDTFAWINYLMGDYGTAETYQRKALEYAGDEYSSAELFEHFGDILEKRGNFEEALEAWKKAAAMMEAQGETDSMEYKGLMEKITKAGNMVPDNKEKQ